MDELGGMSKLPQTVVFEIRDEYDARNMCEVLAMNGYTVKVELDKDLYLRRYWVYVQAKEMN